MGAGGAVAYLQLGGDSVLLPVLLVCGGDGGRRGGGPRVFRDGPPQLHVGLRAVGLLRVGLLHRQTGKNKRSYRESITQTNSNILSLSLLLSVIRVKSCNNGNSYATVCHGACVCSYSRTLMLFPGMSGSPLREVNPGEEGKLRRGGGGGGDLEGFSVRYRGTVSSSVGRKEKKRKD